MQTTETYDIPASVSQRLLWMIKHYRSDYGALNCPVVCRITGQLDTIALQRAVDGLSVRHDSLRTTFHGRGAQLFQRVHPPRGEPVLHDDLSAQDDPRAAAGQALAAELRLPIDLQEWPARARLWRVSASEHLFCLNLHHLVTDAWSTGILIRDLSRLYGRVTQGRPALPPAGWSLAQFVEWQRCLLAGDRLRRHQDYWRHQLAGARLPNLGSSSSDSARRSARCDTVDLAEPVVVGLRGLARRERTTLFTVLLALFHAQLHRVTGEPDITVASMFANRNRPELRETVGLLAGMVLLRAHLARQHSLTDLVRHCHGAVLGAFTYSELPFQLLPPDLVDAGGGRADDVMFNVMLETQHLHTGGGVRFELVVPTDIGSRFPFELALVPVGESGLRAALFRAPERLDAAGGARFLDGFVALAATAVEEPDTSLARLLTTRAWS
ncbi:MAG: condensation domain-containing protein [Pseudonocardiaceae bacterium]